MMYEKQLEIHNSSKESVHPDQSFVYSNSQTPMEKIFFFNNPIADLMSWWKLKNKTLNVSMLLKITLKKVTITRMMKIFIFNESVTTSQRYTEIEKIIC